MAERQFGPYRLVRQVAVGGMAEIHLAKTKGIAGFEKYVALKMIHPNFAEDEQFIQMLVDEAKIAVQLTHGNIAQTFDLGRVGETYYITMEYVDGADLYKILRRGSEQDLEMPLDVCAFIAKEMTSALDHAHRKRDNFGKNLGIVHRDVSPQNVLVSYAGEVKLVDFGIAKATMKARQTAVGVIKGKYYYMSPEQAWGDNIDYRSDIFSAGIVLYEMITGQMLYLEEDLQKLLDMARKADIAPPSTLRRGVPPQLERIVMHALAKKAEDRYQSAGDFATDLERFLHTYSPVFTAGKIAAMIKKVLGDPMAPAVEQDFQSIEFRDGTLATHTLTGADLLQVREELRDENSVIFRVADLKPPPAAVAPPPKPAPPRAHSPSVSPVPRTTRASDPMPVTPKPVAKIPSIAKPSSAKPTIALTRPAPAPAPRPRQPNEETREVKAAPPGPHDESIDPQAWDGNTINSGVDDLDSVNEHTLISAPSRGMGGFMIDVGEDNVDATVVSDAPRPDPDTDIGAQAATDDGSLEDDPANDEDGPTLTREPFKPRSAPRGKAQPPPAAFAAKIHAPAVSSLRQPKARRGTPPGGVPQQPNVLQQIVSSQTSEPMPVPRSPEAPRPPAPPQQFPNATPGMQTPYGNDASGMPIGMHTPPPGTPLASTPGVPPHLQPYAHVQGQPPQQYAQHQPPPQYAQNQSSQQYDQYGRPVQQYPQQGYPNQPQYQQYPPPQYQQYPQQYAQQPQYPQPTSPNALYQFAPHQHPPQQMSLTGQLRLFEADEMPSQYKIGAARRRWFTYIVAGIIAISVAAAATLFIIRSSRDSTPTVGSVLIESVPPGAEIVFDGERLTQSTPSTIKNITIGTRHEVRIELARHVPYVETVDIPKRGGEIRITARLAPVTGRLRVVSTPENAEVWIDGKLHGRTPAKLENLNMGVGSKLELRLKDYQPYVEELKWPANGQIDIERKLQR